MPGECGGGEERYGERCGKCESVRRCEVRGEVQRELSGECGKRCRVSARGVERDVGEA